jgi:hypothetical protein
MKPLILNTDGFPEEFNFRNDQFPPLDALTYWHFLKKAERVIEIGCGYSTILPHLSDKDVTAIDPEPRIMYPEIPYYEKRVQDMPLSLFDNLKPNDILFIDSSHIYSEGSDVEYLINKVMPTLRKGVLVHFHDYFGEEGYPDDWKNKPEMEGWNENEYILQLTKKYTVLASNYEISKKYNQELLAAYPFVPRDITENLGAVKGASIWFKI